MSDSARALMLCLALNGAAIEFVFWRSSYANTLVPFVVDSYVLPVSTKKRAAPEPVPPVFSKGVRYEVVHWGKSRGLSQNGGYIAAIDLASGRQLWVLKVYEVTYDGNLEQDKQDVFITEISLAAEGSALEVVNEHGARYSVDLVARTVAPR